MVTHLRSLVRLCCGEGRTLRTNISGVCGERSWCMDHTVLAAAHSVSGSTLLRLQGALQGCCPKQALHFVHFPGPSCSGLGSWDLVGRAFCALPGQSSSGDQVLGECTVPGRLCILITSPVLATWSHRCAVRALSQVCRASPLGSWSQAVALLADVN